jgi:hypothetical protein
MTTTKNEVNKQDITRQNKKSCCDYAYCIKSYKKYLIMYCDNCENTFISTGHKEDIIPEKDIIEFKRTFKND